MPRIDIRTTLSCGCKKKKHDILVVTRGATAVIDFDLYKKIYTIDDMDQFTVLLKQDDTIFKYVAFQYFILTTDGTAKAGTTYYEKVVNSSSRVGPRGIFIEKDVAVGASVQGLYVEHTLVDGETSENWQLDSHFRLSSDYKFISLVLDSEETAKFKATYDDCMLLETATRLNTDTLPGMHGKDSLLIDRWHGIKVIDSIYSTSNFGGSNGGAVCSDTAVCE